LAALMECWRAARSDSRNVGESPSIGRTQVHWTVIWKLIGVTPVAIREVLMQDGVKAVS
ncbi:hypothetical protein HAX54_010318, partial [Datura stramonium]|nr:hypothetical protein [Datura stramonium]